MLILGVVVGYIWRVPELLDPRHKHLCSEFLQYARTGNRANKLMADELPESIRTNTILFPKVDEDSAFGFCPVSIHGVPSGGIWQSRVEQGASEDIDLILVGEFGLLLTEQRREDRPKSDFCNPINFAICRDGRLNASSRWPKPGVALGQV
ncbi:MAG: hypothetical protein RLZZ156_737 [Deinococcota bacterium]